MCSFQRQDNALQGKILAAFNKAFLQTMELRIQCGCQKQKHMHTINCQATLTAHIFNKTRFQLYLPLIKVRIQAGTICRLIKWNIARILWYTNKFQINIQVGEITIASRRQQNTTLKLASSRKIAIKFCPRLSVSQLCVCV